MMQAIVAMSMSLFLSEWVGLCSITLSKVSAIKAIYMFMNMISEESRDNEQDVE